MRRRDVIKAMAGAAAGPLAARAQQSNRLPVIGIAMPLAADDPEGRARANCRSRRRGPGRESVAPWRQCHRLHSATGKWLELLKEIAPQTTRAALLRDRSTAAGIGQWGAAETFAPSFGLELRPVNVGVDSGVERAIAKLASEANGGIIVTNSGPSVAHRDVIIALAARYRLPAVYGQRLFAVAGGLMSYGSNSIEPYRRAASYVVHILKGEKPADLPAQNPTKFELIINLKTAKALGLEMPGHLLARADEVIE